MTFCANPTSTTPSSAACRACRACMCAHCPRGMDCNFFLNTLPPAYCCLHVQAKVRAEGEAVAKS